METSTLALLGAGIALIGGLVAVLGGLSSRNAARRRDARDGSSASEGGPGRHGHGRDDGEGPAGDDGGGGGD